MRTEATAAAYLEYMIDAFYDDLGRLSEVGRNLADDELETLYALGYNLFTYGRYVESRGIFSDLTHRAPFTAHYWRALGAANQQLKDYAEAIAAYEMAVANDETDVIARVYRSECQILAGDAARGLSGLADVVKLGSGHPGQAPWFDRAALILESLHSPVGDET